MRRLSRSTKNKDSRFSVTVPIVLIEMIDKAILEREKKEFINISRNSWFVQLIVDHFKGKK
jgi:hypothetical protein